MGTWQKDNSYNHQPMRSSSQITNSDVMCQNRQSLRDSPEKNDDLNEKMNINSKSGGLTPSPHRIPIAILKIHRNLKY